MGLRWHRCPQLLIEDVHILQQQTTLYSMEGKQQWPETASNSPAQNTVSSHHSCDENSSPIPSSPPPMLLHRTLSDSSVRGEEMAREICVPSDSGSDYDDSEDSITEDAGKLYGDHGNITSQRSIYSSDGASAFEKSKSTTSRSMVEISAENMALLSNAGNLYRNPSISSLHISQNFPANLVNPNWLKPARTEMPDAKMDTSSTDVQVGRTSDSIDDQPLDLSTKPFSNLDSPTESNSAAEDLLSSSPTRTSPLNFTQSAMKVPVLNTNRHIFKAKPRLSPMAGRRTYTEHELQAALRDIQSKKLGTRRAAVIYNIPRSTLRNKVYKLAMEKERDLGNLYPNISATTEENSIGEDPRTRRTIEEIYEKDDSEDNKEDEEEEDIEKEDLSGPEEEVMDEKSDKAQPVLSMEDLIRYSKQHSTFGENESLRALLQHGSKYFSSESNAKEVAEAASSPPILPSLPPQFPPPPYSMFPPATDIWGSIDPLSIAPYLSHIMAATRENLALHPYLAMKPQISTADNSTIPNFGLKFPPPLIPELVHRMMEERLLIEEQQRKREQDSSKKVTDHPFSRIDKSLHEDRSQTCSPSRSQTFKSNFNKNGSNMEQSSSSNCMPTEYHQAESSEKSVTQSPSPRSGNHSDSSSPPILTTSHGGVSLRDAIAKSISHRFQQPQDYQQQISNSLSAESFRRFAPHQQINSYSSVIKSHSSIHHHHHQSEDSNSSSGKLSLQQPGGGGGSTNSNNSASGKGTRPKRGKYRNYDRDSLVEAVRAVQRGEMSVHRAGSYYGVPHSTLEYKVKERHLMRPRKREPKNSDDLKKREDGSVLRLASTDKPTTLSSSKLTTKSSFSTPTQILPNPPNGLKIPVGLFDTSTGSNPFNSANHFPFWPPNPFHQIGIDFPPRSTATFPPSTEQILASHFAQRLQQQQQQNNELSKNVESAIISSSSSTIAGGGGTGFGKNAREVAESLYDGSGVNGSFLDGIIRSSLETGLAAAAASKHAADIPRKNLLEQLYKNKYIASLSSCRTESENYNFQNPSEVVTTSCSSSTTTGIRKMSPESSIPETDGVGLAMDPRMLLTTESIQSESENDFDKSEDNIITKTSKGDEQVIISHHREEN